MKPLLASILLLLLTAQTFSKWLIVLHYQWNRNYIAQTLCENRSRPQLHCKGKCQLAKKLAADEKENKTQSGSQQQLGLAELWFDQQIELFQQPLTEKLLPEIVAAYLLQKYTAPFPPIFHPPATA